MKNYNIKTFAFVAILLINSCTSSDVSNIKYPTINIADNIGKGYLLNISEIAESVEYIPLQTTDSSLVGNLSEVYYSNGFFVLNTYKNYSGILKIFDRKGQFYNTLNKKGRGPEEYTSINRIDTYKNNIIILAFHNIHEYSFDGKFIKSLPVKKDEFCNGYGCIKKLDDNHYLLTTLPDSKNQNKYSAVIVDSLAKIKLSFSYPKSEIEIARNRKSKEKGLDNSIIFNNKSQGKVITGNDEFIFSHSKDYESIDTIYRINYGKYKITSDNIMRIGKQSSHINIYGQILESNNHMFFNLSLRKLAHKQMKMIRRVGKDTVMLLPISCALYDKRDGSFRLIDQPEDFQKGFVDDLKGGPAFWPSYISDDEYMVSYIDAIDFILHAQTHKVSDKFKKIADGLNENDNPVVALVKLKR
ncbi:MAG: 6-bladed beta-propeller [Bacteroidales bacterium]